MEFNKKLQELRKQKGITQEELAKSLYVSRTAVSKWESGKGYPNIDSLKRIAKLFSVTVDQLLSSEELIDIAQEENKQRENYFKDLVFGLLDISATLLLFLPLFAQRRDKAIKCISLLSLTSISTYLKMAYFVLVFLIAVWGILTLALQNYNRAFWMSSKNKISLILNIIGVLGFIISLQPYPAVFLFIFLTVKVLMLVKKQ